MDFIVILLAKILSFVTGLLGGGTGLPGRIALKLRSDILRTLAKGYRVILVTGTNGKTTTAGMLKSIIEAAGNRAVISESGANMKSGIVSCLIKNHRFFRKNDGDFAVLEVDEAYMRKVTEELQPEVIAVTNIFRDQLDRYGEVDNTLKLIEEACVKVPDAHLVLCGDEGLLYNIAPENKHFYYGFRVPHADTDGKNLNAEGSFCKNCHTPYNYNFVTFGNLGDYECPGCMHKRPELDLGVSVIRNISPDVSHVSFDDMEITVPQPGIYNIYNALCAASCAKVLGISADKIAEGISCQQSRFGRQETIKIDSHEIRLILVKNPAGANEAISSVLPDRESIRLGCLLSDSAGDGTDVSWIYDVDYEKLCNMNYNNILVGGSRAYDMAVRLKTAGLNTANFDVCEDFETLLGRIQSGYNGRLYMFATYTAMVAFRKFLHKKRYIKKLWY